MMRFLRHIKFGQKVSTQKIVGKFFHKSNREESKSSIKTTHIGN